MILRRITIKLLIIVTIMFTIVTTSESKQPCPSGWTSTYVEVLVNGCIYEVQVCFICAFTHPDPYIRIMEWRKKDFFCQNNWTNAQIGEVIHNTVFSFSFIRQFICLYAEIEPCDQQIGVVEYTLITYVCWREDDRGWDGIWMVPCVENDNTCEHVVRYCYSTVPPVGPTRITVSYTGDPGQCESEGEYDPDFKVWITDCFRLPGTSPCVP